MAVFICPKMHEATFERVLTSKTSDGGVAAPTARWALVLGVIYQGTVQDYSAYVMTIAADGGIKFKQAPSKKRHRSKSVCVLPASMAQLAFRKSDKAKYIYNDATLTAREAQIRKLAVPAGVLVRATEPRSLPHPPTHSLTLVLIPDPTQWHACYTGLTRTSCWRGTW